MITFESSHGLIFELVKDFKSSEAKYMSPSYQEAEVRMDFINRFFEALGWDVYHKEQKNPYEQEVKVEKGVSVGRAQKRADYAFFISPEFRSPKFFAEAKKPSRNLKNADDYFQTIRYGWNANTPVAVLTDFQELHILDCRIKPNINTVLENPAHKSYCFEDYIDLEKFAEIFYLLSRDAVAGGSLEKYSGSLAKPKGKIKSGTKAVQAIDEDFLEYIDGIRERLAKAFKKNDESLSSEELTEATQKTIDRLVFIRFLEDKLIEPQNIISEFGRRGNAFKDFISASGSLDSKYNGIVFKEHFIDKKDFKGPNETEFKKVCEEFSHLNSPYDFNAIPVHIIGSIYERFLGKVVNATAHRVKVEEKPEVRKAGGVYYTPKYIVDYIVENTVGKIIRNETDTSHSRPDFHSRPDCHSREGGNPLENTGKTPAEISKLRFADIACGSGSFLIGVFETLLKYHTEYYNQNPEQARKDGCIEKDGAFILSIKQKQKILQNNIYGVDIDLQAVEVTQLSLALKMLEDETTATANEMQVLFHEKILPDLSKNIVCGNSLIGTDILEGKMFGSDEERKLNPMDFETTFPDVFKSGGFDAIVGNPPYVRQESLGDLKNYFAHHYSTYNGMADLYTYFIEKGTRILKDYGKFSYIVSNKWMRSSYGKNLRKYLQSFYVKEIIDFGELPVFKTASTFPMIVTINKTFKKEKTWYAPIKILNFINLITEIENSGYYLDSESLNINGYSLVDSISSKLLKKIENNCVLLGKYIDDKIYFGIKTGFNEAFIIDKFTRDYIINEDPNSKDIIKPLVVGDDVRKYQINFRDRYLILTKVGIDIKRYPSIFNHLLKFKRSLEKRWDKGNHWWELRTCAYYDKFLMPKIIWPDIAKESRFAFDEGEYFIEATVFLLPKADFYLLGVLNSKLVWFWLSNTCPVLGDSKKGGRLRLKTVYTLNIPIKEINFQNVTEKQAHDKIVSLVEQMLEAKKQLHGSKTEKDKTYFERKCGSLDKQIDSEVYKLYGLTEDEIKIVEEKS